MIHRKFLKSHLAARLSCVMFLHLVSPQVSSAVPIFRSPILVYDGPDAAGSTAVGDVNGDEIPDVVVTGDDKIIVYTGVGDGTLVLTQGVPHEFPTGRGPTYLLLKDVNRDGHLDAVVANRIAGSVSVLNGSSNGTFAQKVDYLVGAQTRGLDIADLDNDGYVDIVTANQEANTVSVLFGSSLGYFGSKVDTSVIDPWSVAILDFNSDGFLDIAVGGRGNSIVKLTNGGNRTFCCSWNAEATPQFPMDVKAHDMNNDGKLDLICANYGSHNVSVLIATTNGSFATRKDFSVPSFPVSLALSDFDKDGFADIIVSSSTRDLLTILRNTNGSFTPVDSIPTADYPTSLSIADFNLDSQPDIVCIAHSLEIFMNDGSGTFGPDNIIVGQNPSGLKLSDLNGDGYLDMLVSNYGSNSVDLFSGLGGLGHFTKSATYGTGNNPSGLDLGDVDGDGLVDLCVANQFSNSVSIRKNLGNGIFGSKSDYPTGRNPTSIAVKDVTNDGRNDIIVTDFSDASISILKNDGVGSFYPRFNCSSGPTPTAIVAERINADSLLDLVAINSRTFSVYYGRADNVYCIKSDVATIATGEGAAFGDFNHDGFSDIVVAIAWVSNNPVRKVSVYLGGPGGYNFDNRMDYEVGAGPYSVAVADINGDNNLDILTANSHSNSVSVLVGYGDGNFADKEDYGVGRDPRTIVTGDFDHDGRQDIAIGNYGSHDISILRSSENTTDVRFLSFNGRMITDSVALLDWQVCDDCRLNYYRLIRESESGVREELGVFSGSTSYSVQDEVPDKVLSIKYWLLEVARSGIDTWYGPFLIERLWTPTSGLGGIYPNPVQGVAEIKYFVGSGSNVSIKVFDMSGRFVGKIVDGFEEPGAHTVTWDPRDSNRGKLRAGMYMVRFSVNGVVATKKFTVF